MKFVQKLSLKMQPPGSLQRMIESCEGTGAPGSPAAATADSRAGFGCKQRVRKYVRQALDPSLRIETHSCSFIGIRTIGRLPTTPSETLLSRVPLAIYSTPQTRGTGSNPDNTLGENGRVLPSTLSAHFSPAHPRYSTGIPLKSTHR